MIENIVIGLLISILIMCGLMVIWCIISIIKCNFTSKNHMIILDAIYDYTVHLIHEGQYDQIKVTFNDMETFDATQKRFWDWGYTRILPPEKFELIKPFIRHRK